MGVFQNQIEAKYDARASAWYAAHDPGLRRFMKAHASRLAGASPKAMACWAWTFGVLIHRWIPTQRILHPFPSVRFAAMHPR